MFPLATDPRLLWLLLAAFHHSLGRQLIGAIITAFFFGFQQQKKKWKRKEKKRKKNAVSAVDFLLFVCFVFFSSIEELWRRTGKGFFFFVCFFFGIRVFLFASILGEFFFSTDVSSLRNSELFCIFLFYCHGENRNRLIFCSFFIDFCAYLFTAIFSVEIRKLFVYFSHFFSYFSIIVLFLFFDFDFFFFIATMRIQINSSSISGWFIF